MGVVISGVGIVTSLGQGKTDTFRALLRADHAFRWLTRPGREAGAQFLGAEIESIDLVADLPSKLMRTVGNTGRAALAAVGEAWADASLHECDPERVGLIVGGSNIQQRELILRQQAYAGRVAYVPPSYAAQYLDSDLCGLCTEVFGVQGPSYVVGGASASGQLAVIEAARMVSSGEADVCIAVGALADLSYWELQALRSSGAMGSDRFANEPELACRPFDTNADGFIFGEACAAVVVESSPSALARDTHAYARVSGFAMSSAATRTPAPSFAGEVRAIALALARAGLAAEDISYVNPHGTGSASGDATEIRALKACGLGHAPINSTKSLTGHGLSAAGAVEIVVTLLQMESSVLHPCRNLDQPIAADMNWVTGQPRNITINHALSLSMGFGGINTAICLSKVPTP